MRLTSDQLIAIKQVILLHDPEANIHLFGSRIDDQKKGGDIDILIISNQLKLKEKLTIRYLLKEKLGDRKIDLVICTEPNTPFTKFAFQNSILL